MTEKIIDMAAVKKRKAIDLAEGNERTYRELNEFTGGQFRMDAGDMRREMMFDFLVDQGVITEEARWDFEIQFQTKIEDSLGQQFSMARDAKAEAEKGARLTVVKEPEKKLIVPGRN